MTDVATVMVITSPRQNLPTRVWRNSMISDPLSSAKKICSCNRKSETGVKVLVVIFRVDHTFGVCPKSPSARWKGI